MHTHMHACTDRRTTRKSNAFVFIYRTGGSIERRDIYLYTYTDGWTDRHQTAALCFLEKFIFLPVLFSKRAPQQNAAPLITTHAQQCQSTNSHDRKLPELSPEVLCRDTAMPGLARETESESSRSADGDTSQVSVVRDWQRAPCQPGAHWH